MKAIGLMSGTSFDGVDAALVDCDGERIQALGHALCRPYTDAERDILGRALAAGMQARDRRDRSGVLAEAEAVLDAAHAEAVRTLLAEADLSPEAVDVIGYHGQTVIHRPEQRLTVQIGDGSRLAAGTGIPVVADFRAEDVASGGQGAPLVPVYHRALAAFSDLAGPLAVINIGGVANVTFVAAHGDLLAFDTGPGNALIDDLMRQRTGAPCDHDGAAASSGRIDEAVLVRLLTSDYFLKTPPKSLDRNDFRTRSLAAVAELATPDAAATLAAFTAEAIARSVQHMPASPARFIVAGGGARNPAIMSGLRTRVSALVETADDIGWSADALEAQAFAFLAVRSLAGLPLSFPTTTGVPSPMPGGTLHPAAGRALPKARAEA